MTCCSLSPLHKPKPFAPTSSLQPRSFPVPTFPHPRRPAWDSLSPPTHTSSHQQKGVGGEFPYISSKQFPNSPPTLPLALESLVIPAAAYRLFWAADPSHSAAASWPTNPAWHRKGWGARRQGRRRRPQTLHPCQPCEGRSWPAGRHAQLAPLLG